MTTAPLHSPSGTDREAARELAQQRLAARRLRVRRIRTRTIAAASATFAMAWGIVFGQLVTGDDPALGGQQTQTTATPQTSDPSSLVESPGAADTGGSSSPADQAAYSEPSPVTTSQS